VERYSPCEEMPPELKWSLAVERIARCSGWLSLLLLPFALAATARISEAAWLLQDMGFGLLAIAILLALLALPSRSAKLTLYRAAGTFALYFLGIPLALPQQSPSSSKYASLNNVRQLAVAAQAYAQDYGETYPGWVNNGSETAPRYAHNAWDEQIAGRLKSQKAFCFRAAGIRSPSQPGPERNRVLTYGLNGALIAPWAAGHAAFSGVRDENPPAPLGPSAVPNPAGTILFAELATDEPMDGVYGQPIPPDQRPKSGGADWAGTEAYQKAQPGWIDIDPRAFCELTNPRSNNYVEPYEGAVGRGVGRNLYGRKRYSAPTLGGGACYAFCDGHVQFLKLAKTVGIGQTVNGKLVTADNCWESWNTDNMWNPL
jgi:prepilin-type processing-associated H-X9-DG protein